MTNPSTSHKKETKVGFYFDHRDITDNFLADSDKCVESILSMPGIM